MELLTKVPPKGDATPVHVFEALADLGLRAEQGRKEHGVALTRVFRARR